MVLYLTRAATLYAQQHEYVKEADCYHRIASAIYGSFNDYERGKALLHKSIATNNKAEHPHVAVTYQVYQNFFKLYLRVRQFDSAKVYINKITELIPALTLLDTSNSPFAIYYTNYWNEQLCEHKSMTTKALNAIYFSKTGSFTKAKVLLEEILAQSGCNSSELALRREMEDYYANLMGYYGQLIELRFQTISHLQKTLPHSPAITMAQSNIARLYRKIGLQAQSIQLLEHILEQQRLNPVADSLMILKSMNSLGELYRDAGSYEKALEYYHYTLELVLRIRGELSFSAGSITNNIGETYYALGHYQEALKWHQRALTIRLQLDKHPYRSNSYDNLGMTYLKLGKLEQAEKHIMKAYQLREQEPKSIYYSAFHIKSQLHLAALAQEQGNIAAALQHYKRAIEVNKANLKEDYISKHRAYNLIGHLQLSQSNWEEAKQTFSQALHQTVSTEELSSNLKQNISIKNSGQVLISLMGKAQALVHQYEEAQEIAFLYQAFDYYQLSTELASQIRKSYSSQKDKLNMSRQTTTLYKDAVLVSDQLYQLTQDQKYLEALFQISEQSKAGILLDAQNEHMADNTGVFPDSLLEQEHRLAALNSYYQQQINTSTEAEQRKIWQRKHFENQHKQESFTKKIEQHYPEYFTIKYQMHNIEVKQLQAQLKQDETFIEFFDAGKHFFVFIIEANLFKVKKIDALSSTLVQQFRKSILIDDPFQKKNSLNYVQLSHQLYNHIIAPLGKLQKSKLVIVPDGLLWHINIELLMTEKPANSLHYQHFPYLLYEHAIRYAYSGAHLLNTHVRTGNGKLLAFAPSYQSLNDNAEELDDLGDKFRSTVGPLIHNQSEVQHIHQKFEGEVFLGKEALERQFKTKLVDYSILHLAMHALIDNEEPTNSRLVFTHQPDSVEDNFLHVYELYNMELSADLVVLSACNTGLGKLEGGEGFMSLGRAFAYAGCPSVVMSHWKVDDLATSKLMDHFYDELAKGFDKSTALQTAKLRYLAQANPRETAPFLWGSFVVMGDDVPIKIIQPSAKWPYFLIGFLLVVLAIGANFYLRNTPTRN